MTLEHGSIVPVWQTVADEATGTERRLIVGYVWSGRGLATAPVRGSRREAAADARRSRESRRRGNA